MKKKKYLEYLNVKGTIEYSKEDKLYFGKILDDKALILYEGKNLKELEEDFKSSIIDHLNFKNGFKI